MNLKQRITYNDHLTLINDQLLKLINPSNDKLDILTTIHQVETQLFEIKKIIFKSEKELGENGVKD